MPTQQKLGKSGVLVADGLYQHHVVPGGPITGSYESATISIAAQLFRNEGPPYAGRHSS